LGDKIKVFLKDQGIRLITSKAYTPQTQGQIERFNGTLKSMIMKYFEAQNTYRWIDQLQAFIRNYNSSAHGTIGVAPKDALENIPEIKERIQSYVNKTHKNLEPFKKGQRVRIAITKKPEDKSIVSWSSQIYEISKVIKSKQPYLSPSYEITPEREDKKRWYHEELQLIPEAEAPEKLVKEPVRRSLNTMQKRSLRKELEVRGKLKILPEGSKRKKN
jgi:hypothetical protein